MASQDTIYRRFQKTATDAIIRLAPRRLARINQARVGFPERVYVGSGGIGDDLLCSCIFHELKKRGARNIVVRTAHPELFQANPDVDRILRSKIPFISPLTIHGLNLLQLAYWVPLHEHFLASMCRQVGVSGEVALRPYLYLREAERAAGRLFERQIVIQSAGRGAMRPMRNKEWSPERFQLVADQIRSQASLIQLGTREDPPLQGALDLRGKTSLRQAAALLSQSLAFVGQVGLLMHLARAVECRSVIVYGGRETPQTTGYVANRNLVGAPPCSPCWLEDRCDFDRICLKMITVENVVAATMEQLAHHGSPLEVERVELRPDPP